jgi:hypothetical protein
LPQKEETAGKVPGLLLPAGNFFACICGSESLLFRCSTNLFRDDGLVGASAKYLAGFAGIGWCIGLFAAMAAGNNHQAGHYYCRGAKVIFHIDGL